MKSQICIPGIVLFEMLTGRLPYQGESPVSIALKHLQEPFPWLELNPEIPDAVSRIIARAVAKEPAERFSSAREMAAELTAWLQGREGRSSTIEPAPITGRGSAGQSKHKTTTRSSKRRTAVIAGAVLLLALFVFAAIRLVQVFYVPEVEVPAVEGETLQNATNLWKRPD